jgi:quinol monooxygenase YgiN
MDEPQAGRLDDTRAAVYVVAYVEVLPTSTAEVAALLERYCAASRQEPGNVRVELLQQRDRPELFALIETWRDQPAFEAHAAAPTRHCRERLQALRVSPYDERLHTGLEVGATPAAPPAGAVHVVTHADAIPPGKDEAIALLQQLAMASRREAGNVRFEVLQQRHRPNHLTIVELWQDEQARQAHVMAAHTRQFRERFHPLSGSLYDERLYWRLG